MTRNLSLVTYRYKARIKAVNGFANFWSLCFWAFPHLLVLVSLLAELSLLFKWKYIWGWSLVRTTCRWCVDNIQTMCGWHESEISGEISPADDMCHLHIIRMSSGHLPELPNFMEYCTWCHPHVICTSSTDTHVVCTSSAHHLHTHVICMPSACHPHTSLSCPISCSTMPGVICMSSADTHVICMSSALHLQIHTSFAQSSWTPIVFPVPKILVIDVTVVPDVVPDVTLVKTYCLHIIPGSLHSPYGPQLCFLSQKY